MNEKPLQIKADEVQEIWPYVIPFLERPQQMFGFSSKYSMDDLLRLCMAEEFQLWVKLDKERRIEAAAITSLTLYPQSKVCEVMLIGSNDNGLVWDTLVPTICDWAKDNGCSFVEGYGRKGWLKILTGWLNEGILIRRLL